MIILLLTLTAQGGDYEGIVQIPSETTITFKPTVDVPEPAPFVPSSFGYYMPESHYDSALAKSKQLDICMPALIASNDKSLFWIQRAQDTLGACSGQMDADTGWQNRALLAEDKNQTLRSQRNTAWAITGGLVLGAIAVTSVAIGS